MIRVEKSNGVATLSYTQGLSPSSYFSSVFFSNPLDSSSSPNTATTPTTKRRVLRQERSTPVAGGSSSSGNNNNNGILSPSTVALESPSFSKPLLSFAMPGLVAMNHPDKNPNGGSSEFFCLQSGSLTERSWLDGEYAPFGYILEGRELMEQLKPGDVIDSTTVDEWGLLNLVKLRSARTFSEVVQAGSEAVVDDS
mmetsp:Transcript_5020/g.14053  ORF Transcript_5020/g.14053 Transcript_5020/m.14053 type:complete len:196 (+) Transcript_5020:848-1435(+)